jgi:predicted phage tail protein
MLREVKLYGELAEKYGKNWKFNINSPQEAIKAMCANNPSFREFLANSEGRGIGYKIKVGKSYIKGLDEVGHPSGRQEIKIIPVVLGAKDKGWGMVILGIILLGAVFMAGGGFGSMEVLGGLEEVMFIGSGQAGSAMSIAMKIGAGLLLGGIASLLAPTPKAEEKDQPTNYGFSGPVNTTKQGNAVPIAYGQLLVGGAVISAGIVAEDYVPD